MPVKKKTKMDPALVSMEIYTTMDADMQNGINKVLEGHTTLEELLKISVNEHTENKNGLTYLSWTWAWSEFKKKCPNASYEIVKFDNNLPYVYDENTAQR